MLSRGFNEVTSDPGIYVPYYQIWNGSVPTVNMGSNGLPNFDNVVAMAKKNGLRLIVALYVACPFGRTCINTHMQYEQLV